MVTEFSDEGIVLKSFPYKEREVIATLFTQQNGLISLIFKKVSSQNTNSIMLSSLFNQAEYHFTKGRSDIYRFTEGSILNPFLDLREKLEYLNTAGAFAKAILASQLPGKPAPLLYSLLISYLKRIPHSASLSTLRTSFYIKLLKHEGLLHPLDASLSQKFNEEELDFLLLLFQSTQFKETELIDCGSEFENKVRILFENSINI